MKTSFIPVDYDSFDFKGKNYVKIIGRDSSGKRVCIIDSCEVYMWAILEDKLKKSKIESLKSKIEKISLDSNGRNTKVESVELHDKKFLDKKVKALKIFCTNYKDMREVANRLDFPEIKKRRGYDLGYITHYIIERKIKPLQSYEVEGDILNGSQEFGGIGQSIEADICLKLNSFEESNKKLPPKALAYDIETDELEIGKGEILMVSLVGENFKKVITWKKTKEKKPDYVHYVDNESDLLEKFSEEVKKFSPDFLVGYFSDGFDLPYIKARAKKHKIKLKLGLDGSEPMLSRGFDLSVKISGITHVDILKFVRTVYAQYMKSETLSLNEVSKEFLGDEKTGFELKHSSEIKENDWNEYYKYNLQDSVLTLKLFEKFWPDMLELTKIIQEPLFEISRKGLSRYLEKFILHNLEKFNEIPEKKPGYNEIASRKQSGKVEGAFVFSPKPGLYEKLAMFDFTSMHTSIIISMNLSKGTLLEKKEKSSFESPEIELNNKKQKFYFSKVPGFFPELSKELFEKRKQFKEEYKKNKNPMTLARSNAFKVLSASTHGYIGFFGARYYSLETAASILGFVRKFNQEIIEKTQKEGFDVIYGDTDSVAFTRNKKSKSEIKDFLKKLNTSLPGIMKLELEGFFERGLWVTTRAGKIGAKKKYALIDEDEKIKIRGFETVRRDWCQLARKLQNEIIKFILKDGDEEKALEYSKKIIKKLKDGKVNKKDLIIRTQLKKPLSEYKAISPHVVAARKMKEQEMPISEGGLVEYYLGEPEGKGKLIRDMVKLPNEEGDYNIEYYLEKQILPSIENIFQVFDIKIKEIIQDSRQEGLGKWF